MSSHTWDPRALAIYAMQNKGVLDLPSPNFLQPVFCGVEAVVLRHR